MKEIKHSMNTQSNTSIKKIFEYNKDYLTKDLKILVAKYKFN